MTAIEQGEVIKSLRKQLFWSARRLARETSLSASYVSQIERGERPLTAKIAVRMADAFGMPPYELLQATELLPPEDVEEAKGMARRALAIPSMVEGARWAETADGKYHWLVADYLFMLGHDPYAGGYDGGPGGNALDWTALVPDAPEPWLRRITPKGDIRPLSPPEQHHAPAERTAPSPIEGWDDLTDADRQFVQQMVNKLRRPSAGE